MRDSIVPFLDSAIGKKGISSNRYFEARFVLGSTEQRYGRYFVNMSYQLVRSVSAGVSCLYFWPSFNSAALRLPIRLLLRPNF